MSSLLLSKTCENFRSRFEIFSCFQWSSLTILIVAHHRDGAPVSVPLMPGYSVRNVDRREVSIRGLAENFDTFHPLAT